MTRTQRLWLTLGPAALVVGGIALALGATSDHSTTTEKALTVPLTAAIGWSFIASGLVAWGRRPENRTGPLMVLVGFTWFFNTFNATNDPWVFSLSLLVSNIFLALFIHLLVAYPTGRLSTRFERTVVVAGYVAAVLSSALVLPFEDDSNAICTHCPRNTLVIWGNHTVAEALNVIFNLAGVAIAVSALGILVVRRRGATAAARRILDPVLVSGAITLAFLAVAFGTNTVSETVSSLAFFAGLFAFVSVPYFFLAGLLRFRLARAAAGELLQEVSETPSLEEAQDGLRRALHDPTLELAWWVPESGGYVDREGHPFTPTEASGRAITTVEHESRPLAVVVHDAALLDEPELLNGVLAAARLALVKDRLQAELLARLVELQRQRDYIAVLVNAAPTFFCVIDLEGRIVRFNDTLIAASGTPDDEAVRGKPFWEVFVDAEDAERRRSRDSVGGTGRARAPLADRPRRVDRRRLVADPGRRRRGARRAPRDRDRHQRARAARGRAPAPARLPHHRRQSEPGAALRCRFGRHRLGSRCKQGVHRRDRLRRRDGARTPVLGAGGRAGAHGDDPRRVPRGDRGRAGDEDRDAVAVDDGRAAARGVVGELARRLARGALPDLQHGHHRAQGAGARAATLAGPHRRGRGSRAAAPRAQPPRRRAAAARLALARAAAGPGEDRDQPGGRGRDPRPGERRARARAGGAPRARARDPPRRAHRPRPDRRARDPRRAGAAARRASDARGAARAVRRGGRLLRRRGGTDERRQVRRGRAR